MAGKVGVRLALLVLCLLVFIRAGHVALPLGIGFFRFVNPRYVTEPVDWVIVVCLALGIVVSVLSIKRWEVGLLALSVAAYTSVIILACRAWADASSAATYITAVPFGVVSAVAIVWAIRR